MQILSPVTDNTKTCYIQVSVSVYNWPYIKIAKFLVSSWKSYEFVTKSLSDLNFKGTGVHSQENNSVFFIFSSAVFEENVKVLS